MPLPKLPGGGSLASTAGASAAAAVTRVVALRASRRVIIISFRLWIRETGNLFEPATQACNDARSTVGFAAYAHKTGRQVTFWGGHHERRWIRVRRARRPRLESLGAPRIQTRGASSRTCGPRWDHRNPASYSHPSHPLGRRTARS